MRNVAILYCGSSFIRSLYEKLADFKLRPIIFPSDTPPEQLEPHDPLAVVITGSPDYVNFPGSPKIHPGIYTWGRPVLGICYGMQVMARDMGGAVKRMSEPETEWIEMSTTDQPSVLFRDFEDAIPVWMVHTCKVTTVPEGFSVTGSTDDTPVAAMENEAAGLFGVQFHPEHRGGHDPTIQAGTAILWNFLNGFCGYEPPND